MFPIGDDQLRGARTPYFNYLFIAINVAVFLYEISLPEISLPILFAEYAVVPADVVSGSNYKGLFTSMFMHGGWMHLIGNMLFLWVFGDNIEAVKGHLGYIIFYLIGGLAATLAHIASDPTSHIPSLGASGAIAAMLGAYLVWFPGSKIKVLVPIVVYVTVVRVSAFVFLGIWAVTQIFSGMASLGADTAQTGGVAWWAHIGGFAFGVAYGIIIRIADPRLGGMRKA